MTEPEITYYEHYQHKDALELIEKYCIKCCGGFCMKTPRYACSIFDLKEHLLKRTYQNVKLVSELKQLTHVDDGRYPSEEFLVCLREDTMLWKPENVDTFLNIIKTVWWAEGSGMLYDDETGTLTLHTWGWSGNEAIIEALCHNPVWWLYMRDAEAGGHYVFKLPIGRSENKKYDC